MKKIFCFLLPAHLDAVRLSVLQMAIGRKPPSVFMRAINIAPKRKVLAVWVLYLHL